MSDDKINDEDFIKALISKTIEVDEDIFPTTDEAINRLMRDSQKIELSHNLLKEVKERLFNKKEKKTILEKIETIINPFKQTFYEPVPVLFRKKKELDSKTKQKLEQLRNKIKKDHNES